MAGSLSRLGLFSFLCGKFQRRNKIVILANIQPAKNPGTAIVLNPFHLRLLKWHLIYPGTGNDGSTLKIPLYLT